MHDIPDYGAHMTLQEFRQCVESGGFIDYDGHGCLATDTQESDIVIIPSQLKTTKIDPKFTHVVWYNR
jgi:hypothetical protein